MKSTWMRKTMVALSMGALLITLVTAVPGDSVAANLTGGSYTYVINGEEATFAFDPISRKDGLLLPIEVFQRFGITVDGALGKTITLKKSGVIATVTLGSATVDLNGQPDSIASAPLRLNGRLFVPGDLLKHFGVEFTQDGTFVILREYVAGTPTIKNLSDSDYNALLIGRKFTSSAKADSSIYLNADFTLLTPEILSADKLDVTYGTRSRLQSLMQTNTLVMVNLSNSSFKSGAVVTSGFYLVDSQRNQYDLVTTMDAGRGAITAKIAPAAQRVGFLVFPKAAAGAGTLVVYYDNNGATLGVFINL